MTRCLQCGQQFICPHPDGHKTAEQKREGCREAGAQIMRHVAEVKANGGRH